MSLFCYLQLISICRRVYPTAEQKADVKIYKKVRNPCDVASTSCYVPINLESFPCFGAVSMSTKVRLNQIQDASHLCRDVKRSLRKKGVYTDR